MCDSGSLSGSGSRPGVIHFRALLLDRDALICVRASRLCMSQAVDNGPRLGFSVNGGTASVSGPGERLLTVPEAEESTRIAKLARQHSCRRKTLCWLLLLDAVLNMSLIGAAFAFSLTNIADAAALTAYSLAKSPFDSVGLSAARWLVLVPIALSSSIGSRLPATTVALWWLACASLVLAVCKVLVFGHSSAPLAANALIFTAVLAAAVEVLQANRCLALGTRLAGLRALQDEEAGEKRDAKLRELLDPPRSSFFGYWRIMRPYFWPTGVASKLRVLATFFVLGGSKACNLFSPLYIGAAAQTLSDGRVPYREVGAYCGLRFASSFVSRASRPSRYTRIP